TGALVESLEVVDVPPDVWASAAAGARAITKASAALQRRPSFTEFIQNPPGQSRLIAIPTCEPDLQALERQISLY
ncbi:MAG TPA: hypothetical protein VHW60_05690, partial [Caulobacteraceae bacterium]|nr:hypothetical protein [Caulobacteraceae bacterium]